ncbi:type II secretion system protein [Helicobacter sp. UBA3407]|uniref:type II secretion system protein n=1 Tax=Helicobacter TaxID=209 RepID=UPI002626E765|nr:type II secretion system protein [Helicobacter sp. UBA3407]
MRHAWTLIEMLFALILLGILGVLGGSTLLRIYQNYHHQNDSFIQEIQVQNALLQIKRLLENSYLESLMLSSGEEIGSNPLSLKGRSLIFYEKTQEYVVIGDYSLPCLHGFFVPESAKINNVLTLEFLSIDLGSNGVLNKKCSVYQKVNLPQKALFVTSDFIAPRDFYNSKFQGKILELNANQITLEIPHLFKTFMQAKAAIPIIPKMYFLHSISSLSFGDSIFLESKSQLQGVVRNTQEIIQEIADFKIAKTALGIALEICVNDARGNPHCANTLVVEVE